MALPLRAYRCVLSTFCNEMSAALLLLFAFALTALLYVCAQMFRNDPAHTRPLHDITMQTLTLASQRVHVAFVLIVVSISSRYFSSLRHE